MNYAEGIFTTLYIAFPYSLALFFLLKALGIQILNRRLGIKRGQSEGRSLRRIYLLLVVIALTTTVASVGMFIVLSSKISPNIVEQIPTFFVIVLFFLGIFSIALLPFLWIVAFGMGELFGIFRPSAVQIFRHIRNERSIVKPWKLNTSAFFESRIKNIPHQFYFSYWIGYSVMAAATGLIVGSFFPLPIIPLERTPLGPYLHNVLGACLGLLFCQYIIIRAFWGGRRGELEYKFREKELEKDTKNLLASFIGQVNIQTLYSDDFLGIEQLDGGPEEAPIKDRRAEDAIKFLLHLRAAKYAQKKNKYQEASEYLKTALSVRLFDLVANFQMARCLERLGRGDEAMASYEASTQDPLCQSQPLMNFLLSQIEIVKKKGPRKRPPMPGLMHLGMGR